MNDADRLAALAHVLDDPPLVHVFETAADQAAAPSGVWSTDSSCYEFIVRCCSDDTRSLETGIGLSTVLLTLITASHVCVAPFQNEVDVLARYLDERQVPREHLSLVVGWSEEVLPRLEPTPLDLVFIDGGHGFPAPVIDYYYAAGRLRRGGVLVIDDVQLPTVHESLTTFIDRDSRWRVMERTEKWVAYERLAEASLREEWTAQHDRSMFAFPEPTWFEQVIGQVRSRVAFRTRLRRRFG